MDTEFARSSPPTNGSSADPPDASSSMSEVAAAGASVSVVVADGRDRVPMLFAVSGQGARGVDRVECVRLLLVAGADVNVWRPLP